MPYREHSPLPIITNLPNITAGHLLLVSHVLCEANTIYTGKTYRKLLIFLHPLCVVCVFLLL